MTSGAEPHAESDDADDTEKTVQSDEFGVLPDDDDQAEIQRTLMIPDAPEEASSLGTADSEEFEGGGHTLISDDSFHLPSEMSPIPNSSQLSSLQTPEDAYGTPTISSQDDSHDAASHTILSDDDIELIDETDKTLQSDDFLQDSGVDDFTLASGGDASGATFVSDNDIDLVLSKTWGAGMHPGMDPSMTIKGAEVFSPQTAEHKTIPTRRLQDQKQRGAGEYELVKILGEGGMGVVWNARQRSIERSVAIKMIKSSIAAKSKQTEKFIAEAIVTGDLEHPNIVPIHELGRDQEGNFFYAMKQVQGTPWNKVIRTMELHENLDVLLRTCDAIAFAHARGIIHRDLKPENIMLGDFGEVLVMDWGLALPTAEFSKKDRIGQSHGMGGTPAYMSPEMATGPISRIDYTSDVYLLGAILYEIVTGVPPHRGKTTQQCLAAAMRNVIAPTDQDNELIEIALKAMSTENKDRYGSVKAFQGAIRNYLAHEKSLEISRRATRELNQARESGNYESFSRSLFGFEEALALWRDNSDANAGLLAARLEYAQHAFRKGDFDLAESLVDETDPDHEPLRHEIQAGKQERLTRQRMFRLAKGAVAVLAATILVIVGVSYYLINLEIDRAIAAEQDANTQRDIALEEKQNAEDQKKIAFTERERAEQREQEAREQRAIAVKSEEVAREERAKALLEKDRAEQARSAEQYESYIARIGLAAAKVDENAFSDARDLLLQCPQELRNWEWGRLMYLCSQSSREYPCEAPVDGLALSPDGDRFATASWDGFVRIWDRNSGEVIRQLKHEGIYVHAVAWSPDGQLLASGSSDKPHNLQLWNALTGDRVAAVSAHADAVIGVRFSDDGRWLISCSYDNTARLWDIGDRSQPKLKTTLVGHSWWVWNAAFMPGFAPDTERNRLVTVGQDGKAIVWEIQEGGTVARAAVEFLNHEGPVYCVAYHPGGKQIATGGYDRRIQYWSPDEIEPFNYSAAVSGERTSGQTSRVLTGHIGPVRALQFSAEGDLLVSGAQDNSVRVWQLASLASIKTFRGHDSGVRACAISADNRFVLSGAEDQRAILWSVNDYAEIQTLAGRELAGHADAILGAYFSPSGNDVVTASRDRSARIWNVATGREERRLAEGHQFLSSTAVFLRDEQYLATAAADDTTRLWSTSTGSELHHLQGTGRGALLAVSEDQQWLATGSDDATIQVWSVAELLAGTGESVEPVARLQGHKHPVTALSFVPGSSRLVSGDTHGRCILWEVPQAREVWSERHHTLKITHIDFIEQGKILLTSSLDRTIGVCDATTGQELTDRVLGLSGPVICMQATADGRAIVAVTNQHGNDQDPSDMSSLTVHHRVWNEPEKTSTWQIAGTTANDLTIDRAGRFAYLTCANNILTKLELASGKTTTVLDGTQQGGLLWASILSRDDQRLLTIGGVDARLWDLNTGLERMSFGPHGAVAATAMNPAGDLVVTGSWDQSLKFWDVASGKTLRKIPQAHQGYINTAAFSHDGRWLITGGDDRLARIWDVATGQEVQQLRGHTDSIHRAVFSPDDRFILTASGDRTLRIWDRETGVQQGESFQGHRWAVLSADFSPDGTRIVSCSEDNKAILWDVQTRARIAELSGHTAAVTSVCFSPDGLRVLTSSRDNTAKLWDVSLGHEGKEILTLKRHAREVTAVDFSADSLRVLTASRDGSAILWPALDWRAPVVADSQTPAARD
ncbi:MAG: protein kinase [Planctomycetaceae bacterium]|nr:protein kinase [Planctomycetaceae bacterium]